MSRSGLADELPELEASLLEDPSPRNVMRVADACRLAGDPGRALELLEALVAERPAAIAPVVLMAWCLDDLGRDEESRARLEDLRAIDPANPFAAGRAIPAVSAGVEPTADSPGEAVAVEPVEEPPVELELAAPEDETGETRVESDVFEIPVESDFAAAVAELSGILPAPENEPSPDREPLDREPLDPEQLEPLPVHPDEEAEAEPERALTAEQLADVPPSPLYSATLAEIFERQGFEEKAIEIYAEVVRAHPERVDLRERIAELERRSPGEPGR